jgi:hypothetical protein
MAAQAKIVQNRTTIFEPYELEYFLQKHPISRKDATRILHLHRSDRDACDRAAFGMTRNS